MAGLDKIIKQILDDASKEASEITQKAKQEADSILEKAREDCLRIEEENRQKVEAIKKANEERNASSADLNKRQTILRAKQQIIAAMLEKAHEALISQDDDAYFTLIQKMLEKFALAKSGEICFSRKDLDRMPADFETEITKAAKKKGGALRLSEEARPIDGGFILVYGGVEENCSFKALLDARRDELSDKVSELLFS